MRDEQGSTLIETILIGLLLLIPIVWLLAVLADVHRGALASTAAAREAGWEIGRSTSLSGAAGDIDRAVAQAFENHGLDPSAVSVRWSAGGLERGGIVEIEIAYPVPIVQAPFLGSVSGPNVWIRARHVARVDPYRSRG